MFISGCPSNLDPPVNFILPLNILRPRAPSCAFLILCFCVPAHFRIKRVAGLEGHLELITYGFEPVTFVHMYLSGSTRWGVLRWIFFQWGHMFFAGFVFFSFLPRALACLSFLHLRPWELHYSDHDLLLEVALYADLMYSELESSPFIIE